MTRILLATLLGLATATVGCGDYSNEDLEYLNALPAKEDLQSKLPSDGSGTKQQRLDGLHVTSNFFVQTRNASADFNRGLDYLTGLIDAVRAHPPTTRTDGQRSWGPYALPDQPGFELRVVIDRQDETHFRYRGELRKDRGDWFTLLEGGFDAALGGVRKGRGSLLLRMGLARTRGVATDPGSARLDTLAASYDTQGTPISVDMTISEVSGIFGPGNVLSYQYREAGKRGAIRFHFEQDFSTFRSDTRWTESGAGRGDAVVESGPVVGGTTRDCWDPAGLLTFQFHSWEATRSVGDERDCPAEADLLPLPQ